MPRFSPHSERELPLAQWTYELTLHGLRDRLIQASGDCIVRASALPRWRVFARRRWMGRVDLLLFLSDALAVELKQQEQGAFRG